MTSEHDALLQAILADPAADLPRLVYADFIEERMGEVDRAEFIRSSCGNYWSRSLCDKFELQKSEWWGNTLNGFDIQPWFASTAVSVGLSAKCTAYVDRGFVSRVSAPLDVLMGGECDKCEGDGVSMVADYHRWKSCKTCHGTGRTPAILPRLVREQPIEFVKATSSEPYHNGYSPTWYDMSRQDPVPIVPTSAALPTELFILITGECNSFTGRWKAFPTREAAEKALSDALIKWAKQKENLK